MYTASCVPTIEALHVPQPLEVDARTSNQKGRRSDDLFDFRLYIPVLKDPDGGCQCNHKIQQRINDHELARDGGGRKG
jgi:hypothetical protein